MVETITLREQRAARNQAMMREVNEQLEGLADGAAASREFVCECADPECIEPIELTSKEYESVRTRGSTFVIAAGHVYPDVERVVSKNSRFVVAEKLRSGGELARAHDPRARRRA